MIYNAYMPAGKRVYNVYMPTGKRVYNVRGCSPDVCAGGGILQDPNDFGAASVWMKGGLASVVEDFGLAPDCVGSSDKLVVGPAQDDFIVQNQTVTQGTPLTVSIQVKKETTMGSLKIINGGSLGFGNWTVDLSLLGTGWETLTPAHPAVNEIAAFAGGFSDTLSFVLYGDGAILNFEAWCAHASVT